MGLMEVPLSFIHSHVLFGYRSSESRKIAQTQAGVKLFPSAISPLYGLLYNTSELVNISSIVRLMTLNAHSLFLWALKAVC